MGLNEFAGRIGKVIKHEIEKAVEIIAETRKGYNQKGVLYNSSGEDSPPVKDDKIVILKVDGSGKGVIIGVFNETQGAKPGEKIFFARNEDGEIKSKLSMLGNGEVLWELDDYFELLTEKTIKIEAKEKIGIKTDDAFDIEAEKDFSTNIKGKYFIGNDAINMGKLLLGLIDEIENLMTFGPPPQHKIHPSSVTSLETYKNTIKSLLKESA